MDSLPDIHQQPIPADSDATASLAAQGAQQQDSGQAVQPSGSWMLDLVTHHSKTRPAHHGAQRHHGGSLPGREATNALSQKAGSEGAGFQEASGLAGGGAGLGPAGTAPMKRKWVTVVSPISLPPRQRYL